MGSENAHRCEQDSKNSFGFDFLVQNNKGGDEFLNFNCECLNQRAVKAVDAQAFTKQAENF
jgi:hypothetical protein